MFTNATVLAKDNAIELASLGERNILLSIYPRCENRCECIVRRWRQRRRRIGPCRVIELPCRNGNPSYMPKSPTAGR